jgi:metallo-beta-lactamase family protein
MKITFIGATNGVTGSKTLLEINGESILIDSGLYQEGEDVSYLNHEVLPFDVKNISAVVITHAHLDHTGLLPVLFKNGYRGPIYLTEATSKLAHIIIADSAKIMEDQDKPLYSVDDATHVVSLFKPKKYNTKFSHKNLSITFHKGSHILGAAFVEINAGQKTITFSGDLGRYDDPLLGAPENLCKTNFLIMESTYGNRRRLHKDMQDELLKLIEKAKNENLTLLVPCFALHRSQLLIYLIRKIFSTDPELQMPLYLNSPMMEEVTKAYKVNLNSFIVPEDELKEEWSDLHFLEHYWDIERVNNNTGAQIILASSGMLTGGRIWTHLLEFSKRSDVVIFLPGYQAPGTPGYDLASGKKNIVSPEGVEIIINSQIITSEAFSSHGDQEDLLKWLMSSEQPPEKVFLIHGEEESKKELKKCITDKNIEVIIPSKGEEFKL